MTGPVRGARKRARSSGHGQARTPRSPLRTALFFVGALLFLFEEALWTVLTRFFAWLGRMGLLSWLDAKLVRLPPVMALVILCIPMVLLFPVKVAGLWMIGSGRFVSGCLVMLGAKILSTAVIARIFLTCKPQLMQMPWFARLHAWACALRERVHRWLAELPAWSRGKRTVRRLKARLRAMTGGRTEGDGVARRATLWRWRTRRKARRDAALAAAPSRARAPRPKRP